MDSRFDDDEPPPNDSRLSADDKDEPLDFLSPLPPLLLPRLLGPKIPVWARSNLSRWMSPSPPDCRSMLEFRPIDLVVVEAASTPPRSFLQLHHQILEPPLEVLCHPTISC